MKKTVTMIICGAALALAGAAEVNCPLGTYVYTGSVLNYRHEVRRAAENVIVQAVAKDGTVLASSRVIDPMADGINYRLEVPVSTTATKKSAALGDTFTCVVVDGGVTNAAPDALPAVLAANAITNVNIVSDGAAAYAYRDGTVAVGSQYVKDLAPLMRARGYSAWDPAADWDGDGVDNYSEYVAGTNPFDASDFLHILDFRYRDPRHNVLTFEYVGGHLYTLSSTPSLADPDWRKTAFSPDGTASEQLSITRGEEDDSDVGTITIYVRPTVERSRFFKVEVK